MHGTISRLLHRTLLRAHENPLGLPRSGTPPYWPRMPKKRNIRGVNKVIAVSSAKGGVGKSTIAANLSLSFARMGFKAGILDVDIFGPSIPTIFNLSGEPRLSEYNQLMPLTGYGVKTMSMGYLVGEEQPVVWRGPMVIKAIQQLLHEVDWGELDVLVLDLPPGTGDTQLTITQQVVLEGAVIVSTPHTLAVKDALKGINMFKKTNVNILGMVQNMSLFTCPNCHHDSHVFGGNQRMGALCEEHQVDFLGDIPLDQAIGHDADTGRPTVAIDTENGRSQAFFSIAGRIAAKIGLMN
ncbi:Iron-sulfur protein IND1 [Ceratocystis fimbriata CBS 114723]|uniref:Iron-sulfur protein IND1 n=1 Tax=Ceratocystis fimbriata CBS 114723 TaxID=1035309 RepID=A0A2C5WW50_9PEZI|nr:Iron-sulfur protein IND1 [Ceratocystis fimbriata CBS 114723]